GFLRRGRGEPCGRSGRRLCGTDDPRTGASGTPAADSPAGRPGAGSGTYGGGDENPGVAPPADRSGAIPGRNRTGGGTGRDGTVARAGTGTRPVGSRAVAGREESRR
ncbi:MAG: hypothetical protein ACOC98_09870, partial [Thermodesulfobacteriota bacterium]